MGVLVLEGVGLAVAALAAIVGLVLLRTAVLSPPPLLGILWDCYETGHHQDPPAAVETMVDWHTNFATALLPEELKELSEASLAADRNSNLRDFFAGDAAQDRVENKIFHHLLLTLNVTEWRKTTAMTKIQDVDLLTTDAGQEYLLHLDGFIQSSSVDEFVYHETAAHVALVVAAAAGAGSARVFIGGGAEGALLREVLRWPTVSAVTLVDIDGELLRLCEERLGATHHGALADPRATVVVGDARTELEKMGSDQDYFDAIILDFPDPTTSSYVKDAGVEHLFISRSRWVGEGINLGGLYSREFYALVAARLKPGGVLVTQVPSYWLCAISRALESQFRYVRLAGVPMISYPANLFFVASNDIDPTAVSSSDINQYLSGFRNSTRWYDGNIHQNLWELDYRLRVIGSLPALGGGTNSACTTRCAMLDYSREDALRDTSMLAIPFKLIYIVVRNFMHSLFEYA